MDQHTLAVPAVFATIGWVAWLIFTSLRHYMAVKVQSDFQVKLVQRISTPEALRVFVESDAGRQFLKAIEQDQTQPYRSIIGGVQACVVFLIIGFGFLSFHVVYREQEGTLPFGLGAVVLGVALGASSAVSYFLHRSFGLIHRDPN